MINHHYCGILFNCENQAHAVQGATAVALGACFYVSANYITFSNSDDEFFGYFVVGLIGQLFSFLSLVRQKS